MGSLQVELQPLDPCQTLKMKAYHSQGNRVKECVTTG